MVAGDERVDLGLALAALGERGHRVVLTEGGPTLLGLLADGGYLDELCRTLAPMMGDDPLAGGGGSAGWEDDRVPPVPHGG